MRRCRLCFKEVHVGISYPATHIQGGVSRGCEPQYLATTRTVMWKTHATQLNSFDEVRLAGTSFSEMIIRTWPLWLAAVCAPSASHRCTLITKKLLFEVGSVSCTGANGDNSSHAGAPKTSRAAGPNCAAMPPTNFPNIWRVQFLFFGKLFSKV